MQTFPVPPRPPGFFIFFSNPVPVFSICHKVRFCCCQSSTIPGWQISPSRFVLITGSLLIMRRCIIEKKCFLWNSADISTWFAHCPYCVCAEKKKVSSSYIALPQRNKRKQRKCLEPPNTIQAIQQQWVYSSKSQDRSTEKEGRWGCRLVVSLPWQCTSINLGAKLLKEHRSEAGICLAVV